ncbi:hypothetical protein H0H92_014649 [Tricholoma furcatifolium]|nr:hypothetical protein H0H92_014649 [Tricholoma furcatifolium]
MVWSSAQPHNVASMVLHSFKNQRSALLATWTRAKMGLSLKAYHATKDNDVPTVKDLAQVWAEYSHSSYSTLLMDDSDDKAILQPYNHLVVPEYDMTMRAHDLDVLQGAGAYDDTLICVVGILDAMKDQTNVANWIRSDGIFLGENIQSPKRWWEVPELRQYWKERGTSVLEKMEIKIEPGVDPAPIPRMSRAWAKQ